jgi:hypothetical protein
VLAITTQQIDGLVKSTKSRHLGPASALRVPSPRVEASDRFDVSDPLSSRLPSFTRYPLFGLSLNLLSSKVELIVESGTSPQQLKKSMLWRSWSLLQVINPEIVSGSLG